MLAIYLGNPALVIIASGFGSMSELHILDPRTRNPKPYIRALIVVHDFARSDFSSSSFQGLLCDSLFRGWLSRLFSSGLGTQVRERIYIYNYQ